jgi:SRSO17 transposase
MTELEAFEHYLAHLNPALRHRDREAGLRGYCTGLLAPLARKSVEPIAAHLDPNHTRSLHESLHHFVADSAWSDSLLLERVAQWVLPKMDLGGGAWWVVSETYLPKHGHHIVGVGRHHDLAPPRAESGQLAVCVSLACAGTSLPLAWRLVLPPAWAEPGPRRDRAGVPKGVTWATRSQIALALIGQLRTTHGSFDGVVAHCSYGADADFAHGLQALGLPLKPAGDSADATALMQRAERVGEALKRDFGLGHYEGRGWRGVHHHASLCIAAYAFALGQPWAARRSAPAAAVEPSTPTPRLDAHSTGFYKPRGSPAHAAPRPLVGHSLMGAYRRKAARPARPAPPERDTGTSAQAG